MEPVTILILGAGSRGTGYAAYAREHPDRARIVGVAEPRQFYRERLAAEYGIPPEHVYHDWKEAAQQERLRT